MMSTSRVNVTNETLSRVRKLTTLEEVNASARITTNVKVIAPTSVAAELKTRLTPSALRAELLGAAPAWCAPPCTAEKALGLRLQDIMRPCRDVLLRGDGWE